MRWLFGVLLMAWPAQAVTLIESVDAALTSNYALQSTAHSIESQRLQQGVAMAGFFPSMQVDANRTFSYNRTIARSSSADDSTSAARREGVSVSLSQPLFNLSTYFDYESASITLRRQMLQLEKDRSDTINLVVNGYFTYLRALAQLKATRMEVASAHTRLAQMQRSYELGHVAKVDIYESEASLRRIEATLEAEQNGIVIAARQLRETTLLHTHPSQDLRADYLPATIDEARIEEWHAQARRTNHDILLAANDLERADNAVHSDDAAFAPTLSVNASYGYNADTSPTARTDALTGASTSRSVTLNVSLPLFSGGSRLYASRRSRVERAIAGINRDNTHNTVFADMDEVMYRMNSNVRALEILTQTIRVNRQSYHSIKKAYELGSRSLTDVLDAERTLYSAMRDYVSTRYDVVIAYVDFHRLQGTLDGDFIHQLAMHMHALDADAPLSLPALEEGS